MKIIILGAGHVGVGLTEYLINERNEITLVDTDIEKLRNVQNRHDIKIVKGYASYPATLRDADADNAELIVAVTDSDETNMLACQLAYSLFNVPQKIARIRNNDYLSERNILFNNKAIPIDNIIAPEFLITEEIANLIKYPGTTQIVDFCHGKVCLSCVKAYYGGISVGNTINAFNNNTISTPTKIVAIYRQGKCIQLSKNTSIEAGDEIFYISATPHVRNIMSQFQKITPPYRRIMIVGGGNIGKELARLLCYSYDVKLVETNLQLSQSLADEFDKTKVDVYCCDPSNQDFLLEEHIDKIDLVVCVTDSDETNIMSALLAKKLGAKKSIVLIQKSAYINLIQGDAIDIVVSPQEATISSLLSNIRRNGVAAVRSIKRGIAEGIEIKIQGDENHSNFIGRKVEDIKLPPGTTICSIIRDNEIFISNDKLFIKENDNIIFFVSDKKNISELIKMTMPSSTFFSKLKERL